MKGWTRASRPIRHWRFPRAAERLPRKMANGETTPSAYHDLLTYFATGWTAYRTPDGSRAHYPGWPSYYDPSSDPIEGFSRVMPLFGAWCASGRATTLRLPDGSMLSLPDAFRKGLLAGTDPHGPGYWGSSTAGTNQRTVEAADIALALWLFRDSVWRNLPPRKRDAVAAWLALLDRQPTLDNNWHLFYVLADRVLTALGHPGLISGAAAHYRRAKEFHLGDGWFTDGPGGHIDFYNAWAFHYLLTWIDRIDPNWDHAFIHDCQRRFTTSYRYLVGPQGVPIMGRSIPYRLAVPAPLVAAAADPQAPIAPAEARRALDAVWHYFVRRGALRHGTATQGYFGPDPRLVDRYAGPASSLWSLRSLVMAFWFPPTHPFWRAGQAPLPVEQDDYQFETAGGHWRIHGDCRRRAITIEVLDNPADASPGLELFGRLQSMRNLVSGYPPRPHNSEAKYGRRYYSSDRPFCIEEAHDGSNFTSRNTVLLAAPDGTIAP